MPIARGEGGEVLRVCLLSYRGNMYCGGQGVYAYYLARELAKLGCEVHLIAGPPYPDPPDDVQLHKIVNHNFFGKKRDFLPPNPLEIFYPLNFFEYAATRIHIFPEMFTFSIRAFRKLKELGRFDIIHDNQCLGFGLLLMRFLGTPVVATIHHPLIIDKIATFKQASSPREIARYTMYYSPFEMQKVVTRRLDGIMTVSRSAAREIERAFGVPLTEIRVIYNGVDTETFKNDGCEREENSILFVGRTEDRKKGILYLLKAMCMLDDLDLKLTIVDEKPPKITYAPELVRKYGLEDKVRFTGRVTVRELVRLYSSAEVFAAPSLYEGFGFPVAEAMACETPVVATTAGAIPEIVENDETGILVEPGNARALASALRMLLEDDCLRRQMGRAARRRIEKLFSWERAARETLNFYEEVLNGTDGKV
ncbi:MAG TPA: glycosyltransferase family 1 protein [Methanomicrobia archaeon]|nr:glycosyltransferase family 1 protein [Methanomicrobia archaeon]HEX58746.1 glycosyltransferase family 1 protein [Methanomicrobia archaeon]